MRIGCVVVPGEAALAAACGFDYVELSGKAVAAMGEREFSALRAELDAARIRCEGFNAYCPPEIVIAGPGADPKRAAEYAQRLLPRARALGVRRLGVGSPLSRALPGGYPAERARREMTRFFRATGEAFAPAGVDVCVEALGRCYCNCVNLVSEAIDVARGAALDNVGVVVDFYNMEREGEDGRAFLPEEMAWIWHAHTSDDDGSPQARSFLREDRAPRHAARIRKLLRAGYAGDITLEIDVPLDRARAQSSLAILRGAAQTKE